jgi:hypothetical protein
MTNKSKHETNSLKPRPNGTDEMESGSIALAPDSAEGKALQRISDLEKGRSVDWIIIEPDESIDVDTVRERMIKRGYEVST